MPFPKRSPISRVLLGLSILGAATIPAVAQDAALLDGAQLDALLRGHTLYITVPQGTVPFHYGADGDEFNGKLIGRLGEMGD